VKRYAILLVAATLLLPPLPAASEAQDTGPPVPTGHDLLMLTHAQFQLYVSGIYEGHVLMASVVQAEPVVCIDPMLTRTDVAALCLAALPVIPDRMLTLPAAEVVMTILMKQHPCETAETRGLERSPLRRGVLGPNRCWCSHHYCLERTKSSLWKEFPYRGG